MVAGCGPTDGRVEGASNQRRRLIHERIVNPGVAVGPELREVRPVRLYSQLAWRVRQSTAGLPDSQVTMITMDDGAVVTVNAGMALPARG